MRNRPLSFALPVAVGLAGCSSMANGKVAVQARGALSIESVAPIALGLASGAAGNQSAGNADVDIRGLGFGLGVAINTTYVDVIGGFDARTYHGRTIPETSIGLRKRFGPDESPVYLFALARSDRNGTDGEVVFNGMALGAGLIVQFDKHWFVDCSFSWERTEHLDIDPDRSSVDQGVFQVGIGYAF